MASPQPSYTHPGPSSYPHPYPQPVQAQYSYPVGQNPVPCPMQPGQPRSPVRSPSSPTMNGMGRGGYSVHHSRGGAPYQSFHHPHHQSTHQQFLAAQAHFLPPNSYPSSPQKYSMPRGQVLSPPFSSPYVVQPNGPYSPVYSPQALSPLPKQLSMPPPITYHQEPLQLSPHIIPKSPTGSLTFAKSPTISPRPSSLHTPPTSPPSGSSVSLPDLGQPSFSSTSSTSSQPSGKWAIWSRRPHDPSQAPGIIISPRARPPAHVVHNALDLPSPPRSPSPRPVVPEQSSISPSTMPSPSVERHTNALETTEPMLDSPLDIPSSLATETTDTATATPAPSTAPDTPVPGSPLSSNTSVSSPVQGKVVPRPSLSPQIAASSSAAASVSPSSSSLELPIPTSPKTATPLRKSWASLLRPSGRDLSSSSKMTNALPVSSVVGFSIPAPSVVDCSSTSLSISPNKKQDLLALLTSPQPNIWPSAAKIHPRGLVNSGNMCFANVVLQVLVYCPPFYRLFTELGKYLPGPIVGGGLEQRSLERQMKGTPLVDATITFLREFHVKPTPKDKGVDVTSSDETEADEDESFIPTYVYDAMKEKKRFDHMRGGHQEDAEEFFGFYLDTLEEELLYITTGLNSPSVRSTGPLKAVETASIEEREEMESAPGDGWLEVGKRNRIVITRTVKTTDSPITRIFGGKFRSTLRVPGQRDSVMVEDWRSLQLDIQREQVRTIKDALQYISVPQSVQVTSPSRPGVTVEASQQVLVDTLPGILVLHLKRFLYDTAVNGVVKIGKQVIYEPELEIGPEVIAPVRKTSHPARYKLFGVLYHHGLSAAGGHYTLDVLHPSRDSSSGKPREAWIRIDDELVSDVRDEDVFEGFDRDDRCAYLLFYRRLGATFRL